MIRERIGRVCDSFSGQRYELPDPSEQMKKVSYLHQRIQDTMKLVETTQRELKGYLEKVCYLGDDLRVLGLSRISLYKKICLYEMEIYKKLNFLASSEHSDALLTGFFWSPKKGD